MRVPLGELPPIKVEVDQSDVALIPLQVIDAMGDVVALAREYVDGVEFGCAKYDDRTEDWVPCGECILCSMVAKVEKVDITLALWAKGELFTARIAPTPTGETT